MKAQADSSSTGRKDFICREEKDCTAGNGDPSGLGWGLGFMAFLSIA
jgi:hypothetical protein